MVFAVAIIIAVYLPILFLQGLEGRMFRPMAITVCAALAGSLLLALTMIPMLASFAFRNYAPRVATKRSIMDRINGFYGRILLRVMNARLLTTAIAALVLAASLGSLYFIGTEFMPKLDEGSILVETRKLPGISLTESVAISKKVEQRLRQFPEIADVVIKIGRPDFATEAMGINEGDTYLLLRPIETWQRFHTKEELIAAVAKALDGIPGIVYSFTQPMAMRIDETISGVKSDLAVKIFGDDFAKLDSIGEQVLRSVSSVRGAAEAQLEVTSGVAELSVVVDRAALARYGLNVSDVEQAVASGGSGDVVSEVIDGAKRCGVALRLPERYRTDPDAMRKIVLRAPAGEQLTLEQVAHVRVRRGPELINREDGQRRIRRPHHRMFAGRDLGSFVAEVRAKIASQVNLPSGYYIEYGGQFENQDRATRRLDGDRPCGHRPDFRFALLDLCVCEASGPRARQHSASRSWAADRRALDSRHESPILGINRLHRSVRRRDPQRRGARELHRSTTPRRRARARCRTRWGTPPAAPRADHRIRRQFPGFIAIAATSTGAEVQRPLATVVIGGAVQSSPNDSSLCFNLPVLYEWMFHHRGSAVE